MCNGLLTSWMAPEASFFSHISPVLYVTSPNHQAQNHNPPRTARTTKRVLALMPLPSNPWAKFTSHAQSG
jgi:hypothetical protein